MHGEVDLGGVFVPTLLIWAVVALVLSLLVSRLLQTFGVYRWVWHRALFDITIYVIILGLLDCYAPALAGVLTR